MFDGTTVRTFPYLRAVSDLTVLEGSDDWHALDDFVPTDGDGLLGDFLLRSHDAGNPLESGELSERHWLVLDLRADENLVEDVEGGEIGQVTAEGVFDVVREERDGVAGLA